MVATLHGSPVNLAMPRASIPSPELIDAAVPLVPVLRRGGLSGTATCRWRRWRRPPFPKTVMSGGHSAGFDAMCDDLAERIGASRAVAAGAGHEVQFTGRPVNELLLALWRGVNPRAC